MKKIHPSAVIESGAVLADDVEIGPFCYVGPHVQIGAGCRLIAQCHITGYTTLGEQNVLHPFAALGNEPQDYSFDPACVSYLRIGDRNTFRENVTIHRGTKPESETIVGSDNLFMAGSHVGHNGKIGNHVILVNNALVGGYAEVFDHAILSGLVALHQFCRVGRYAIISGNSAFSVDIPPFMMAEGRNGNVKMINLVGLRRGGFSNETIRVLRDLYKLYYHGGLSPANALEAVRTQLPQLPEVKEFIEFCESSSRGVVPPERPDHR